MNYYDILGVEKTATQEEIKQAYRSLVKKYHPDVNKAGNSNTFFNMIQEAYNILGNEESRKNYNSSLNNNSRNADDNYYEANNTNSENSYKNNNNYNSEFNSETVVSDEEIYKNFTRERIPRSIFIKIIYILLKIILIPLIPVISFTKHVSMWISGVVLLISRIIMGVFVLISLKDIYDCLKGNTPIGGWQSTIGSIIVALVAYCLPYIVMIIPVGLELLRDKIQDFIFG
ncbi:J domain-containing protein [Clostridium saccharobutylicum]|uniref:Chaperone protein DnaJ n=1 Tax=Clostridium saccharobutylicum TaxID=169679 RepID=A0A1S8MNF0_CLOSA|nr:DnaJ domain-containing protein [Clostridium saccharobutylicum]OOM05681.1 chaperone protein DnaJ [Clostridium saccharobutylicum]